MDITTAFRQLREAWFNRHLMSRTQERIEEDEERQQYYKERNEQLKLKYDEDTESILKGEKRAISPTCEFDMIKDR